MMKLETKTLGFEFHCFWYLIDLFGKITIIADAFENEHLIDYYRDPKEEIPKNLETKHLATVNISLWPNYRTGLYFYHSQATWVFMESNVCFNPQGGIDHQIYPDLFIDF